MGQYGTRLMDEGFVPPVPLIAEGWRLEPLGAEHNASDHRAWMSSIEHIRTTPGFSGRPWPFPMTREENLQDLIDHRVGFEAGHEFSYTVLDDEGAVIGCVYVLADDTDDRPDAVYLRSWVRADRSALDGPLRLAVLSWLRSNWPFSSVRVDLEQPSRPNGPS
ncbi:MAG: hypothetical protein ACI867_000364 [Glaciecola sp.]|jgi:hypothetical protein